MPGGLPGGGGMITVGIDSYITILGALCLSSAVIVLKTGHTKQNQVAVRMKVDVKPQKERQFPAIILTSHGCLLFFVKFEFPNFLGLIILRKVLC